jgi:hypothetical protein
MTITSRLTRIGRLLVAPIKGFFKAPWNAIKDPNPRPQLDSLNLWAHIKEVARQDTILYFEPFTYALREFKQELKRPY